MNPKPLLHGAQIGRWAWDVTLTTPSLIEQIRRSQQ
jgi:hypothetical protein